MHHFLSPFTFYHQPQQKKHTTQVSTSVRRKIILKHRCHGLHQLSHDCHAVVTQQTGEALSPSPLVTLVTHSPHFSLRVPVAGDPWCAHCPHSPVTGHSGLGRARAHIDHQPGLASSELQPAEAARASELS